MTRYILKIKLESEAAFGRGDGVAGLVDAEVQHDDYGFFARQDDQRPSGTGMRRYPYLFVLR